MHNDPQKSESNERQTWLKEERKGARFQDCLVHFVNIANYAKQPFLVSSRNAPPHKQGALRDDTKLNGCVAD